MKDETVKAVLNLCARARETRAAISQVWLSKHPGDHCGRGAAPTEDEAEIMCRHAFLVLQIAEYAARKAVIEEQGVPPFFGLSNDRYTAQRRGGR